MQSEELIHAHVKGWLVNTPDGQGFVCPPGRTRTEILFPKTNLRLDFQNEQIWTTTQVNKLLWEEGQRAHAAGEPITSPPYKPYWGQVARWWICGWEWADSGVDHAQRLMKPWLLDDPRPPPAQPRRKNPRQPYQAKMF